jgi:hypothetical protein
MKYYLLSSDNKRKEITDGQTWFEITQYIIELVNDGEDLESSLINVIFDIRDNYKLIVERVNRKSLVLREHRNV